MRKVTPLISGTLILTATGLLTRVIGFFYRVYLSRSFGEEGMGIYQLIAPVLALSFSICVAGIQTAISKYVASETTTHNYRSSFQILLCGIGTSIVLSLLFSNLVYQYALPIATNLLLEARCAPLLRIIAISIPFASMHACINGYFYGIKKTAIPAITQLAEQLVRVGSVYYLMYLSMQNGYTLTISCAVVGLVFGEIASMLISLIAIYVRFYHVRTQIVLPVFSEYIDFSKKIISLALPLSANRVVLNLLQSVEAIQIPNCLVKHGLSTSSSLSTYGVLMGMSFPLIFFPSALTNSLAVMLLPTISEAEATGNKTAIRHTITKTLHTCIGLGVVSTCGFLFFGKWLGIFLFSNETAGNYIMTLSFLCPFLYLTTTLNSILHGFGKTKITFCFSILSLGIRLLFVFFAIPLVGIRGYLYGLLLSELIHTLLLRIMVQRIAFS